MSMLNALQVLVSWPLAATVYPLTTRRHCTCHNSKHRAETHRAVPAFALVDRSLLRARPSGGSSDSWVEPSVISRLIFRDTWLI